jgi:excisionase family DNA binding protein
LTEEEREAADPWLTLAEIAAELRVNPATVRQWVSKGRLKASRAGVRKWIVRRSDLDRMLAETNSSADDILARLDRGEPACLQAPPPRRPDPVDAEERESDPTDAGSSTKLLYRAGADHDKAMRASALAPPAPGYVDRIRAVADSCERLAVNLLNASAVAGIRWGPKLTMAERLSYELAPNGNRPGPARMWQAFDVAYGRLSLTATGNDIAAVARAFREVSEALLNVVDELEGDDHWQAW